MNLLDRVERLCLRYLEWLWARREPKKQQAPLPWGRNTVYVGFQAYEVPADDRPQS